VVKITVFFCCENEGSEFLQNVGAQLSIAWHLIRESFLTLAAMRMSDLTELAASHRKSVLYNEC
jgi:hypothetical protein